MGSVATPAAETACYDIYDHLLSSLVKYEAVPINLCRVPQKLA